MLEISHTGMDEMGQILKSKDQQTAKEAAEACMELNRQGVALGQKLEKVENKTEGLESILQYYLRAIQADKTQPVSYQNAGHICVQLKRWEAVVWFHTKVRELDPKYDERPEKDKCGCLVHGKDTLKLERKSWVRTWTIEDAIKELGALPAEAEADLRKGGWTLDPQFTLPKANGKYETFLCSPSGVKFPLAFETWEQRDKALNALTQIDNDVATTWNLPIRINPSHPELSGYVLQSIFLWIADDHKKLANMSLVCTEWLHFSNSNLVWRQVWLRYPHTRELTDDEKDRLDTLSWGEGFLKRLFLKHPPLNVTQRKK